MQMKPIDFALILERVKQQTNDQSTKNAVSALQQKMKQEEVDDIDLSLLAIKADPDGKFPDPEEIHEVIEEILSESRDDTSHLISNDTISSNKVDAGVTRNIILNSQQQEFHDKVVAGESVVLIGPAGTGKTTSMKKTTASLLAATIMSNEILEKGKVVSRIPKIETATKWLQVGLPGAVVVSYTRKAVNNIRRAVVDELKPHTITVHKLLEFGPVFYEIETDTGPKKTMRFEPKRNADNPLPPELKFIAYEESSMIGTDLYELLLEAMPHEFQEVFLGDIQQLPPVFGMAILGFKMLELPVVELTEVYRQARNSPIIDLAWKLLEGDPHVFAYQDRVKNSDGKWSYPNLEKLSREAYSEEGEFLGGVKFQPWQKRLEAEVACMTAIKQFCAWEQQGYYNPEEDIILCPYNEAFGTIELNKGISNYLGLKREAKVHEVIAGFNKHYLAVGDRVLYDKEDAFIVSITPNVEYLGKRPRTASVHLDRWGTYQEDLTTEEKLSAAADESSIDLEAIDKFMAAAADSVVDRVQSASHDIVIRFAFDDTEIALSSSSEINNLLGGYAITVHKFQGSEAERVFIILHNSHAKMASRELLYTAVTRARKWLHIICEPETFFKGISSQRIKGNTLEEKALVFMGAATKERLEEEKFKLASLHPKPDAIQFQIQPTQVKLDGLGKSGSWQNDTIGDPAEELPERDTESGCYKVAKKTAAEILAEIKARKRGVK
jgi:hypothetical protein